jgi:hypothetical protein
MRALLAILIFVPSMLVAQSWLAQTKWARQTEICAICGANLEWYEEEKVKSALWNIDAGSISLWRYPSPSVVDSSYPRIFSFQITVRVCFRCFESYNQIFQERFQELREGLFARWRKENRAKKEWWVNYRNEQEIEQRKAKIRELEQELQRLKEGKAAKEMPKGWQRGTIKFYE